MKATANLLSKILIVLHYPADIGSFAFFYLMLSGFSGLSLLPLLGTALCLGAITTLISGVFYAIWTSDGSAYYPLCRRQTARLLDAVSLTLLVGLAGITALLLPTRSHALITCYVVALAGGFVLWLFGLVSLVVLVAKLRAQEEQPQPRRREPKVTLNAVVESMRQTQPRSPQQVQARMAETPPAARRSNSPSVQRHVQARAA